MSSSSPPPGSPNAFSRTFGAVANPTFRKILAFGGFYYTYRATELAILSWFVLTLTDSEFQVALVGVSRILPMFLFGLMAGGLSDRFNRPRLMAMGQTLNLAVAAAMIILLSTGRGAYWHAYAAIFLTGTTWALDYASRRALLGDMFSGKTLSSATALDAGLVTGANMVGPMLGTVVIRYFDFAGGYTAVGILGAGALALVLSIRAQPRVISATAGRGSPLAQVRDAVTLLRSNRDLLGAVLVTIVFNMMGFPFIQMVPVIARNFLGGTEVSFGFLLSALGAGSLVGAIVLAGAQSSKQGSIYVGGSAILMLSATAFAWSPWYPLSFLFMVLAGMGLAGFASMQPAIPLRVVEPDQRGRAMGAIVLGIGFQAAGTFAMGAVAEAFGPRIAVTLSAAIGIALLVALRATFTILRDPVEPTREAS